LREAEFYHGVIYCLYDSKFCVGMSLISSMSSANVTTVNGGLMLALLAQMPAMFLRGHKMEQPKPPSKEVVRRWLRAELEQRRPPPDPKQIRRELGWDLVKMERAMERDPYKR
jgi:hypothetical protein